MHEIIWDTTTEDSDLITNIVERALANKIIHINDFQKCEMDITATHCNGCELDLQKLLEETTRRDFTHDVIGIMRNINRETGKIENCFLPIYWKKK